MAPLSLTREARLGPCRIDEVSNSRVPFLRDVRRRAFRAPKSVRKAFKPIGRAARIVRHVVTFRAPDEITICPACAASTLTPMLPLPLEGRSRTYGFASGCERCGVVFANPLPSLEQVADVYSAEGEWGRHRQEEQEKQVSRRRIERLFEPVADTLNVLAPPAHATVLDFGCGLGGMLDGLADLGWQTYGIETAMKTAFARHRELTTVPASGSFDLAIVHHVLEHVTDPLTILKQLAGAVREGGILLISVPNLDDLAVHGELKYCIRAGVHVLAYTSACLTWLAADAGFEVVSDRPGLSQSRQRIVLARRRAAAVAKPRAPLAAAQRALQRYFAASEHRSLLRILPVRTQSAVLDLQRTKWRV